MRKFVGWILCAALLCAVFAFAACDREGGALSGTMTVVIDSKDTEEIDAELTVDLSAFTEDDRAADVLDALADAGRLCYTGTRGAYGLFLTAVGTVRDGQDVYILTQNPEESVYLMLYTSVEADKNDYEGMTVAEYAGQTLAESLFGISSMHIEDGAVLFITTVVYGY